MKHYNLYYQNQKINREVVDDTIINEISKKEYIYKKMRGNELMKIPVNKIQK